MPRNSKWLQADWYYVEIFAQNVYLYQLFTNNLGIWNCDEYITFSPKHYFWKPVHFWKICHFRSIQNCLYESIFQLFKLFYAMPSLQSKKSNFSALKMYHFSQKRTPSFSGDYPQFGPWKYFNLNSVFLSCYLYINSNYITVLSFFQLGSIWPILVHLGLIKTWCRSIKIWNIFCKNR